MSSARGTIGAFISVTTLFFAWGFITSNNDPLIAALRAIFSLNYTEALMTQFAFFIAYGLASLPAAAILNRLGAVRTILVALATMIAACFIIRSASLFEDYAVVLAGLFVMAAGITVLQVAANPLAADLGDPSRSHFRLTLAQAFNSLGVVLGVHFGSQIMLGGDVFQPGAARIGDAATRTAAFAAVNHAFLMIAIAIAALGVFIWWSRGRINAAIDTAGSATGGSAFDGLRSRWALLGACAIFLYVGAEVSIGSVMINFLNQPDVLGLPLDVAGAWLANFYWGGALVGRFIGSVALMRFPAHRILMAVAAIAAVLCAIVVRGGPLAGYAALAVGLFNAVMFPTIFTITLERSSTSQASTSGLLCLAIVGGAFLPLVVGKIADHASLFASFLVPAAAYVFISAFAWRAASAPVHGAATGGAAVAH